MKTSLYQEHLARGAKWIKFGGWEMPLSYQGILAEVAAVRKGVGLFDVSHMGRIELFGKETLPFLDYLSTNQVLSRPFGKALYTVFCNEMGFAIDDLLIYLIDESHAFLIVNAGNREKDLAHILKESHAFDVEVKDHYKTGAILSLQGPKSGLLLKNLFALELRPFEFVRFDNMWISRTGYTGEEGYEFYLDEGVVELWRTLLLNGAEPIGLGARDVLRQEMGYALYGHELSEIINPLESVASWTCKLAGRDFIGKNALLKSPPSRVPLALLGKGKVPAREGYPLFYQRNKVGSITSGTFSPTLDKPIALALSDQVFPFGIELEVLIREVYHPFEVVKLPFLKRSLQ